jgi:hypothetical protein
MWQSLLAWVLCRGRAALNTFFISSPFYGILIERGNSVDYSVPVRLFQVACKSASHSWGIVGAFLFLGTIRDYISGIFPLNVWT